MGGKVLFVTVALGAFGVGTAALAERPAAPASGGQPAQVDEVIVTATRRDQRLVDVPASISSVSGASLERGGVRSLHDLPQVVPGLTINNTAGFVQPSIRGVGNTLTNPGIENNVAIYEDGFYTPSALTTAAELNNIDHVEVLKGPQGTLYGRNATGGALLIVTRDPSFSPHVQLSATGATYNDVRFGFYGATGIGDKVAVSLAAYARQYDGYTKDLVTGRRTSPFRTEYASGKILFMPNDSFRATLTVQGGQTSDGSAYAFTALNGNTFAASSPQPNPIATAPHVTSMSFNPIGTYNESFAHLRLEWNLGWAKVTSLTGYDSEWDKFKYDSDSTYAPVSELSFFARKSRTLSQEVYLNGTTGPIDWTVGGYYFNNLLLQPPIVINVTSVLNSQWSWADAEAVYAEATYHITDRLSLSAGARFNSETRTFELRNPTTSAVVEHDQKTFTRLTPGGSIRYEISQGQNVYASIQTGFKSGFFANGNAGKPILPETITAFEVGYKIARGPFRLEAAAYDYEYRNLQVSVYDLSFGTTITHILNAANATIRGVDANVVYRPSERVNVSAGLAYTDAKFSSFPNAIDNVPKPGGGNSLPSFNAAGKPLLRTPKFQGNIAVDFHLPVPVGKLVLTANYSYQTRSNYIFSGRISQGAYGLLGLRASWSTQDEKYTVSVFGVNVSNVKFLQNAIVTSQGDFVMWGQPAAYGVTVAAKF